MRRKLMLVAAVLATTTVYRPAGAQSGDPTTFTDQLNAARAARNLPPVAYNPAAVEVARQNNAHQMARGLGHWILGGFGQCSAVGLNDAASALMAWTNSPAHAAIIYAPSLASVGFDAAGNCCTVATADGYAATAPAATWTYPVAGWTYPAGVTWYWPARRGWRW